MKKIYLTKLKNAANALSFIRSIAVILILGACTLFSSNLKAQAYEFGCSTMYDTLQHDSLYAVLPPNICGSTIDYAPDPVYSNHTPIKTVRLVWHFMCDDSGESNFNSVDLNTAPPNAQSDYMIKVINGLNHKFANLEEETRQDPNHPTPLIVDSRIRFEISQSNIFYHNNTTAIQNIGFGNYLTYFNQYVTNNQAVAYKDDAIHIFFYPHRFGNGSSWAHFAGNIVVHNGDFDDHFPEDKWWITTNSLAHELGHCLGLHHTNRTGGGTCSSTVDDGCDDTPPAGTLNPCPCWNGLASENGHTGDDEWCSTNLMTYNAQAWSLTRCQIGRMHHFLMNNSSVNKFWISDYCTHSPSETISIPNGQNMVWENSRYLKGDLIIEYNATLTVKCYVSIPKNGKVVVKAGGKLIIDGGTLSNRCGEDWHGIFVEGNSNLNQMPLSNQGFVEIKNGAIIENAREAIFLAGLKSTGDIDYSKLGGIVKATNSTFRNNKRDVSFVSYKNTNSIGTEISNLSTFSNCLFVTTSETPFIDNIGAHITMWEVNGVRISGCTFEDQRTIIVKTQGRTGIGTINSTYLVTSYCSNPMMIPCTGTPSVFNNMRSALESRSNGTMGKITIENSEFNSYKGVFLQGINNARIVNNTFTIEHDILVPLNTDYPYGVYLDKCQMFNIEGNTFNGTTGQASPSNGGAAGLVIRNTGANNNLFYRNNFYNIKMASQALSENRATDLQTGLRFRCNDYQETYNDLDIRDDPNNPFTSFGRLGIAELQGIVGGGPPQLPDNQFGNTGSFLNFNIENQGNWVNYLYSGSASQGNRYYPWSVTPNVSRINYNEAPSCPNNLDFWGTDRHVLRDDIELIKPMVVVKANDWDMVTDGGNTQLLINDIQTATEGTIGSLYTQLMSLSPYLSNEVLALIAEQNTPFTPVMIRDILVANPHSARSVWVQTNLDNRTIPLATELRTQINEAAVLFTARDTLAEELAGLTYEYDLTLSELVYSYLSDSLYTIDSVSKWLKHPLNPTYHYQLAELYFDNGDLANYTIVVDSIPLLFNLTNEQWNYHTAFTVLYDKVEEWKDTGARMFEYDPGRLLWLLNYAGTYTNYPARLHALLAANDTAIVYPDVYIDVPAMMMDFTNSVDKEEAETEKSAVLLYPNPATNEVTLKWKQGFKTADVRVYDINGRLVAQKAWKEESPLILHTDTWAGGVYFVQIETSEQERLHMKLVISK